MGFLPPEMVHQGQRVPRHDRRPAREGRSHGQYREPPAVDFSTRFMEDVALCFFLSAARVVLLVLLMKAIATGRMNRVKRAFSIAESYNLPCRS